MFRLLLVGLIAGSLAKMVTPQEEKGGWLSSLAIGIIGSFVGGWIARIIGLHSYKILGEIIIAFLEEKNNWCEFEHNKAFDSFRLEVKLNYFSMLF